jgi:hypothetical protein
MSKKCRIRFFRYFILSILAVFGYIWKILTQVWRGSKKFDEARKSLMKLDEARKGLTKLKKLDNTAIVKLFWASSSFFEARQDFSSLVKLFRASSSIFELRQAFSSLVKLFRASSSFFSSIYIYNSYLRSWIFQWNGQLLYSYNIYF